MRAVSPSSNNRSLGQRRTTFLGGSRTISPLSRSSGSFRLQADADSPGASAGGVRFDDVRPKTAGSSLRLGANDSRARPQTAAGGPASRKSVTVSDGSRTAR